MVSDFFFITGQFHVCKAIDIDSHSAAGRKVLAMEQF